MTRARRQALERFPPFIVAVAVIGYLAWPMLFTDSGMAQDWVNHLWYMWQQSLTLRQNHAPSLFLHDGGAVFRPLYAFYAGTLFTVGGALALVLGDAPVKAYVLMWLLGFASAYGGWYWLARMAGLGRWLAHVPGLVYITSGYYLTLIYARGDWPEFSGVSLIPMLAAAGLSVLFADRLRLGPVVALGGSALIFFGGHSLTMLWGGTFVAALVVLLVVAVPQARRRVTRAGAIRLIAVVVPAALVNAWFLFPALAYSARTEITRTYPFSQTLLATHFLVSASNLFTFSRSSAAPDTPDFITALPPLAIVWVLGALAMSLSGCGEALWRRMLWVLAGATLAVGLLMTHSTWLVALPRPYSQLQFAYRLDTYVLLGLCAAMLCGLVYLQRRRGWAERLWRWAVVVVLVASAVDAVIQVDTHPSVVADRNVVFAPNNQPPNTAGGLGDYDDGSLPLINPGSAPGVTFPPESVRHDQVSVTATFPPGTSLLATNLAGAPYFVAVDGARVVGRDPNGHIVLALRSDAHGRPVTITLRASTRLPVIAGRVVSWLALAYLVVALALLVGLRQRSRRRLAVARA